MDKESRKTQQEADDLRANRNKISKEIGGLMKAGKKEEAEAKKAEVAAGAKKLEELEAKEAQLQEKILKNMMVIPNIIDPTVPIGKDDTENVEITKYGELLFLISKFLIIRKLWKSSMELILTVPER